MNSHSQHLASDAITTEVAQAVAAQRGIDPTELEQPLYTVVDTEALNHLFSSTKNGPRRGTVTFTYCGQRVTVRNDDGDGGVKIDVENGNGTEIGTERMDDRNRRDRR